MKYRTTSCEKPFLKNGQAFGCGQCLPCRLKTRRTWTHRLMLEAGLNLDNAFLTLTYKKDPVSLEPQHHRRFLNTLRKKLDPLRIRYYCVGEYGEKNDRPHLHYIIFGYPSCRKPNSDGRSEHYCACAACRPIFEAWGEGLISCDPVDIKICKYIARYVVKKLTRFDDPRLKGNLHPEFSRMSLKPGIGFGALKRVAHIIDKYDLLTEDGDVPVTLRHGRTEWPLGRYLRKKLRKELGLNEISPTMLSPEASYKAFIENDSLRALQQAALNDPENPGLKYHVLKASEGKRLQTQLRLKNFLIKKGKL